MSAVPIEGRKVYFKALFLPLIPGISGQMGRSFESIN